MKQVSIDNFLTDAEAIAFYNNDRASFHSLCRDSLIVPNMERINEALGQENDPDYLAYTVEYALLHTEKNHANQRPNRKRTSR